MAKHGRTEPFVKENGSDRHSSNALDFPESSDGMLEAFQACKKSMIMWSPRMNQQSKMPFDFKAIEEVDELSARSKTPRKYTGSVQSPYKSTGRNTSNQKAVTPFAQRQEEMFEETKSKSRNSPSKADKENE